MIKTQRKLSTEKQLREEKLQLKREFEKACRTMARDDFGSGPADRIRWLDREILEKTLADIQQTENAVDELKRTFVGSVKDSVNNRRDGGGGGL